jgi:predicted small lipoprotein YifL
MTRRELLRLSAALAAAALAAACGRKGPLKPAGEVDDNPSNVYEFETDATGSGDELWPEDANPNPGEGPDDEPWPMEIDPSMNSENAP